MVKIIYSDGCSLMAGAEHKSWKVNDETGYEECDTVWPALLQKSFFSDAEIFSRAVTSSSNFGIARRTVKFVSQLLEKFDPSDILVCIMWTSMYRKDYRVRNEFNPNKHKNNDEKNFISILPTDNLVSLNQKPKGALANNKMRMQLLRKNDLLQVTDSFYRNFNNPMAFTYDSFSQIEYVNLFLENKGIKSIQCYGFGDHFYHEQHDKTIGKDFYTKEIADRCKKYDIYYVRKERPIGFYEWASDSFELGPGLHPLEAAHKTWARQMMRKIG
jgi:hypothetical protein